MNAIPALLGLPTLALTVVALPIAVATYHDLRVLWAAVPVQYAIALAWSWTVLARGPAAGIRHGALAGAIAGAAAQLIYALFALLYLKLDLAFSFPYLRVLVIGAVGAGAALGALLGATILGIILRHADEVE